MTITVTLGSSVAILVFLILLYLFMSRHEIHSMNTHSAERRLIKTDKADSSTRY